MAKMVGLSRSIKMSWLKRTVELCNEDLSETEFKDQLNEYLSFEIGSPTVLRKTREILMHIWYYSDPDTDDMREEAKELIVKYPDEELQINWCMLLLSYPVFVDLSRLMGRLSEFQDEITLAQIKSKLYDEWGERSTLHHSVDKIIATLKNINVLTSDKPGRYLVNRYETMSDPVVSFMVRTGMKVTGNSYYNLMELGQFEVMYPFKYKVSKEQLMSDERFLISNFGGEVSVALRD